MPEIPKINDINEGVMLLAVLSLMILNQFMGLAKEFIKDKWHSRNGSGLKESVDKLQKTMESFSTDSANQFDKIKNIDENVDFIRKSQEEQRRAIDRGDFSCKIRGAHLQTIQNLEADRMRKANG